MTNHGSLEPHKTDGPSSFLPLLTFLLVYLGSGIFFTVLGVENPFKQISREFSILCGICVLLLLGRNVRGINRNVDVFIDGCADPNSLLILAIYVTAGAFSGAAKGMGAVDSTVGLCMTFVPPQLAVAGVFLVSSLLATALGSSMTTIATLGPVALGIAEQTGASTAIAIAAVLGGAMFGDNLSIISDTTIAATKSCGCEMNDKFKMNFLIALPAAILSLILYAVFGSAGVAEQNYTYSIIKILPYIVVFVTALLGWNVILVLVFGTALCGFIGFATGAWNLPGFSLAVTKGIGGMLSIAVQALLIRGMSAFVREFGGLEWLLNKIRKWIHSRRSAEYGISAVVGMIDVAMGNNTIAILVSAPLAMKFARIYNIAPKRVASLLDIFACVVQSFIPNGGQMMLCMSLTAISTFAIIQAAYYTWLLVIAALLTIQFGLLRTKEEKEGKDLFAGIPEEKI